MLARSKLNSIEKAVSEALINNYISHEGFTTIINEERKYSPLKESIRVMKSQMKRDKLIEDVKRIHTDEIINEKINEKFKVTSIK